jgi:NADPH2:quinone reductase
MAPPARMSHIYADGPGGPEVLRLATTAVPEPKSGEVLIRVQAAGVNGLDLLQRRGEYPPLANASTILGLEVAGEVIATGPDAADVSQGDRVCALVSGGGYAEYCAAPALQCLPWPKGYDAIRAAALPEAYFTVWANVFDTGRLQPGESILVHGGTSGIGITAIQLAREFGARVLATAGSSAKCEACLRLGAEAAINYREDDFVARILEITGGQGVNMVFDIVGAPYVARNLRCLAMRGRLVMIAFQQGSKIGEFDFAPVVRKHLTITGSTLRPRTIAEKAELAKQLRRSVWPVLNEGRCAPVIDSVFPLAGAAEAHTRMESSRHIGKIMLEVGEMS